MQCTIQNMGTTPVKTFSIDLKQACLPHSKVSSALILTSAPAWAGRTSQHTSAIYLSRKEIPSVTYCAFLWAGGCQTRLTPASTQSVESWRLCPSTHIYMHLCNSQETFDFNVWQGSACPPQSYLESHSPDVRVTSPNLPPFSPSICQTLEEWNLNRRLGNLFSWTLS